MTQAGTRAACDLVILSHLVTYAARPRRLIWLRLRGGSNPPASHGRPPRCSHEQRTGSPKEWCAAALNSATSDRVFCLPFRSPSTVALTVADGVREQCGGKAKASRAPRLRASRLRASRPLARKTACRRQPCWLMSVAATEVAGCCRGWTWRRSSGNDPAAMTPAAVAALRQWEGGRMDGSSCSEQPPHTDHECLADRMCRLLLTAVCSVLPCVRCSLSWRVPVGTAIRSTG